MVAAAGAGVAAVDHELVGAEAHLAGLLVERGRDLDRLAPSRRRMDVDLDDAGVGRDPDDIEARIGRRGVALDVDGKPGFLGGGLDRGDEFEIILDPFERRHEHAKHAVARLDGHGRAYRAFDALLLLNNGSRIIGAA